jgi:hypothetical protein
MSGREASHVENQELDPNALEVVPGAERETLEGWVPQVADESALKDALEKAFDYRGNVTITRKDGSKVEGYIFDRRIGSGLKDSVVRLIPKDAPQQKVAIAFSDVAALAFTGRDMAAGKQWEKWVQTYWGKKAAGETGIKLEPEQLE